MNNEPVAWMVDGVLFTSLGAALNISFDIEQPCIPLYTHPSKDLTDEEIDKLKAEYTKLPSKPWNGTPIASFDIYDFARAILRKASE